ncbi:MAG TPA: hypothetical protein VGI39_21910 [Polyangiaceae bacterium]|jgi:hypothetical protein
MKTAHKTTSTKTAAAKEPTMNKTTKSHMTASVSPELATSEPTPTPAPPAQSSAPVVVTTMTDPVVQECFTLLDEVVAKIGPTSGTLSGDEIRRSTKMRKGGAAVIPKILALCQQHGITQIGSLTTAEMDAQLKRGEALAQVGLRTGIVQKTVKDEAMQAFGRSWQIGTTMYTTLQRLALNDAELALGLEPILAFFQTKRTKGQVRKNNKVRAVKKLQKLAGDQNAVGPAPAATPASNDAAPAPSPSTSAPPAVPVTSTAPAPAAVNGSGH